VQKKLFGLAHYPNMTLLGTARATCGRSSWGRSTSSGPPCCPLCMRTGREVIFTAWGEGRTTSHPGSTWCNRDLDIVYAVNLGGGGSTTSRSRDTAKSFPNILMTAAPKPVMRRRRILILSKLKSREGNCLAQRGQLKLQQVIKF
jgi:hypothetical protein